MAQTRSNTTQKGNSPTIDNDLSIKGAAEVATSIKGLLDKLDIRIRDIDARDVQTEQRLQRAEDKLEENKNKSIESLGLFVALFTFISIEFSLFKSTQPSEIISLTLIVAGLLVLFILLLHVVVKSSTNNLPWVSFYIILFLISILLISIGVYFFQKTLDNESKNTQNPVSPTVVASPSATIILTPPIQ